MSKGSDAYDKKNPPSVVGFSANTGKNGFEFVGDFIYQEATKEEKCVIISEVVRRCLEAYRTNRGSLPRRLVVFRNGCGEGAFKLVLKYEVPLIKDELMKAGCNAKVTVIVPNKLQAIRFFRTQIDNRARAPDQNIPIGVVVDKAAVHPEFCEYFLNSHRALQGTARTPKYTVLYDDNKFDMNTLEGITYQLCYGHQIVFMPTSLPSPVYIAIRYSERGRTLYSAHMKFATSTDTEAETYSELTSMLGYYPTDNLSSKRINA